MSREESKSSSHASGCLTGLLWALVVLIGAPAGGWKLSEILAPDSGAAHAVGVASPLAVFLLGAFAWLGTLLVRLILRLILLPLRLLMKRRSDSGNARQPGAPGGSWVFIPIGTGVGFGAGVVIALLSEDATLGAAVGLFTGAGLAYGSLLWLAARRGYLDPLMEALLEAPA